MPILALQVPASVLWFGKNMLGSSNATWDNTPYRIWSLWELLQTHAWNLVNHTEALTVVREDLKDRLNAERGVGHLPASVCEDDKENIRAVLGLMRVWMDGHELHASLDRADRILEMLTEPEPVAIELIPALKTLSGVLEDELKRRFFLYLPPDDAKLYQQPLGLFPKSVDAFRSTRGNIINACRCHALGQSTACVFHSMGILQSGLYSLANELEVMFKFPLTLAEWHNIIDNH